MSQIDVLYSESLGSGIRETLKNFTGVRIESMVNDTLIGVWLDADATSFLYQDDCQTFHRVWDRGVALAKVCAALTVAGHEPFLVTHDIHQQARPVVVDSSTGHLSIYKHVKEYSELLTFGDDCKRHLYVKYDTSRVNLSASVEFTHIWLIGNHYTVRKVKRFIANKMSNGNSHLMTHDLERIKQLIGSTGRVYMLSNIGRVIDLVNSRLVPAGGLMPTQRDLMLTNAQVIYTGRFVERIQETTNLDNILRSVDGK